MADVDTPVIVGPTGIGKTAVALALAVFWPLEVISADSRQVYRTLDVVTAKPTARERQRVPHHLIDLIRPGERFSAGRFAVEAAETIGAVRARGHLPVVVGGSGLYVKALVEGLFAEPPLDRPRRDAVTAVTGAMDHATLVRWAARLDPGRGLASGGRHRAARTIEIALLTGHSLSWWHRTAAVGGQVKPWIVRLTAPRAVLHQRIEARTHEMVRRGVVEEVAAALADGAPNDGPGMDGVGVREAVAVLHGTLPRERLAEAITTATRQYAKRQETWFRHQLGPNVLTLDATRPPEHVAAEIAAAWKAAAA
ncbi:MAG TPA: tRNA (adenosine(37)-N6)-dimethylallyltransferase MiaA [Gemmatimonadales bacterium]